jgi:NAD-dependent SIR2 family protein deacetylase
MIRKTVFVTGAGASAPYAFPTGEQLKNAVIETINSNDVKTVGLFNELAFDRDKMEEFARRLRRSGKQSVDAFLEHNFDFVDVGRQPLPVFRSRRNS